MFQQLVENRIETADRVRGHTERKGVTHRERMSNCAQLCALYKKKGPRAISREDLTLSNLSRFQHANSTVSDADFQPIFNSKQNNQVINIIIVEINVLRYTDTHTHTDA